MLCKRLLPYNRQCGPTSGGIARIWIFDGADFNWTQAVADVNTGAAAPYTAVSARSASGNPIAAATATATITKSITTITVTSGGTGYTVAPTVVFSSQGTGAAPVATATVAGGVVTAITVVTSGSGFVTAPTISFTGAGTGAAATANIDGRVLSIAVTSGGGGYTTAPALTIAGNATATATLTGDAVTSITVVSPGSGYETAPAVTMAAPATTGLMLPILFQRDEAEYKFAQSRKGCSVKYEHSLEFLLPDLSNLITNWNANIDAAGCCCGIGLAIQFNSGKIFIAGERYVNNAEIDIPLYMVQDGSSGTSGKLLDDVNGETAILKGSYPRKLYEYTGGLQSLIDLQ